MTLDTLKHYFSLVGGMVQFASIVHLFFMRVHFKKGNNFNFLQLCEVEMSRMSGWKWWQTVRNKLGDLWSQAHTIVIKMKLRLPFFIRSIRDLLTQKKKCEISHLGGVLTNWVIFTLFFVFYVLNHANLVWGEGTPFYLNVNFFLTY